ncbi:XTP/dITP diphosphatase [Paenibacillus sp. J2TS4]|uniref:XTP/dITP diphosphatase n=1 Tax=Paenibacillus sp. J2TS4 TaxID=2807194 RepID=UPI001B141AE4|nr:XTP/dITP diphosphatase [Paenibacillus sp. J2TS4]GIP31314.1 hypothetical protein J2TS4_05240 [Paenibacillus sp. J2TS4]
MHPAKEQILVIATGNPGKVKEFAHWFHPLGWTVRSLADYDRMPEIVEDGETFADNAWIKASTIADLLKVPVLADDSGLCVDALDGAPGVYSARYAGENASDQDNNRKLLSELKTRGAQMAVEGHPQGLSRASFVCALVLYDPVTGKTHRAEGRVPGYILKEARGDGGFGYDPLFYLPEQGRSMAELTTEEKNQISHRALALRSLFEQLDK